MSNGISCPKCKQKLEYKGMSNDRSDEFLYSCLNCKIYGNWI